MRRFVLAIAALAVAAIFAMPTYAAENAKPHRIAIQVDQNDPALMNLVLNNVSNLRSITIARASKCRSRSSLMGPA
jgi:hypothetical protein